MIRTVVIPNEKTVSLDLPESYIGKQIEIIAFETDEEEKETAERKMISFAALSIDTTGFKFNRDDANER